MTQCERDVSDNSIDLTPLAFCDVVDNDCAEQIACDSVKVKDQGLLLDQLCRCLLSFYVT